MSENKRSYSEPALVNYGPIAKLTQPGSPDGGGGGPIVDIMIMLPEFP